MNASTDSSLNRLHIFLTSVGVMFLCIGIIGWKDSGILKEHHLFWATFSRVRYYVPAGVILLLAQVPIIKAPSARWLRGALLGFAIYSLIYFGRDIQSSIGQHDPWITDVLLFPSFTLGDLFARPLYPSLWHQYGQYGVGPAAYLVGMWLGALPLVIVGAFFSDGRPLLKTAALWLSLLYSAGCLFWAALLISDLLGYHYLD